MEFISPDEIVWMTTSDSYTIIHGRTFLIKDQLKMAGCRYNNQLKAWLGPANAYDYLYELVRRSGIRVIRHRDADAIHDTHDMPHPEVPPIYQMFASLDQVPMHPLNIDTLRSQAEALLQQIALLSDQAPATKKRTGTR